MASSQAETCTLAWNDDYRWAMQASERARLLIHVCTTIMCIYTRFSSFFFFFISLSLFIFNWTHFISIHSFVILIFAQRMHHCHCEVAQISVVFNSVCFSIYIYIYANAKLHYIMKKHEQFFFCFVICWIYFFFLSFILRARVCVPLYLFSNEHQSLLSRLRN